VIVKKDARGAEVAGLAVSHTSFSLFASLAGAPCPSPIHMLTMLRAAVRARKAVAPSGGFAAPAPAAARRSIAAAAAAAADDEAPRVALVQGASRGE